MSITDSSLPPLESQDVPPHRHSHEVDRFVDYFLSLMCDSSRRQILELLTLQYGEQETSPKELRSGEIAKAIGLSPATISGHLRQLSDAGLITSRREGNSIYYRLHNHILVRAFRDLLHALDQEHASRPPKK